MQIADTTYFYKNLNPRKLTDTNSMDFLGDKQEACPGRSPVWMEKKERILKVYHPYVFNAYNGQFHPKMQRKFSLTVNCILAKEHFLNEWLS